ncbi:MAG: hypothetical protein IPG91_03860 [Ideonella sp.]|nr:hypothetical protein [Ideonella sp.]
MSSVSHPVALARAAFAVKAFQLRLRVLFPANLRQKLQGFRPRDAAIAASLRLTDSLRFD